jgi:hypothetical protein
MALVTKGRNSRKRALPAGLPLFDHAEANRVRDLPLPARRLARRWGVAASTARTLAELAGFSMERD